MKNKITVSFLLFNFCLIYPQQLSNWKFYTDMKNINDFKISDDGFWSATSGGAFFFNTVNDSFTTLRRSEGLLGVSLTALCLDYNGKVWFGGSEGTIDVYDPSKNSVHNILDISNSDKTLKQINSLSVSGDTIFTATEFGISLISSENYTFYDTFTKLGSLPSNLRINSATKFDLIYACTDLGIAVQKKDALNLSVPEAWVIFQTSEGLPSNRIFKVVKYQGSILASTDAGLSAFDGSAWSAFLPELTDVVSDIEVSGDSLFILSGNRIYLYFSGVLAEIYSSGVDLISIEFGSNMGMLAATNNGILRTSAGDYIFPNGPQSNNFFNLNVDNESNLWVASGPDGEGLFKYDGKNWLNYNTSDTPQLPSNSYFVAYTAPDNTNYFGNWGSGFLRLRNNRIDIFDTDNTDLVGTDENTKFLVISGFCTDSKNNLWILNSYSANKKTLSMMTPDSLWYHFSIPAAQNLYLERQLYLVIDQYDTKWYCSRDEHGQKRGLFYFNENKTYDNASDDKSGYLTTTDNLTDNSITAIATDLRGDIWVGTGFGVNIISNQQSILTTTPSLSINEVFSLRQQSINCIAVDPLNQKWIGTNQGLQVVNSDGSRLIASYSKENTLLPANEIKSIAIDRKTGRIYVGTDLGLVSFDTPSIEPKESYSELLLYPNPFVLNSKGVQLNIKNLIKDSEIKILTLTGKLVKYLEAETEASPGGDIAFWDGTDTEGNFVSSGIYFVIAFDKEGNNIITGKVAVIKE